MGYFYYLSLLPRFLLFAHFITLSNAATFEVRNQCPYTVWVAAVPGGGRRLDRGQSWTITARAGAAQCRIWGQINCNFDGPGMGGAEQVIVTGFYNVKPSSNPNTLAEYNVNQFSNIDFYDMSLVDGFNVPMDFSPISAECLVDGFNVPMDFSPISAKCHGMRCTFDINGQCPKELRAPRDCNNPCTIFKTNQYCCNSGNYAPINLSSFFK